MTTKAIRENTSAVERLTRVLERFLAKEDKEAKRNKRRKQLLRGGPYSLEQLRAMKRPELVMLAAAMGIKNTSVSNQALAAVIEAKQRGALWG